MDLKKKQPQHKQYCSKKEILVISQDYRMLVFQTIQITVFTETFSKSFSFGEKDNILLSHPNGIALWKPRDEEDGISIVNLNGSIAVGLCHPKSPMKVGFLEKQKERTSSLVQITIF